MLRCAAAPFHWARIAVWGTLGPRLESGPLEIVQGVVEGPEGILLAVRKDLRGWELPGGHVEAGEDHAEALRREIAEEVHVDVEVGDRIGTYVRTGFRPHTVRVHRCRYRSGTASPSPEAHRVRWFPENALPETILVWCRTPLKDALAGQRNLHREEHQGKAEILDTMRIDLRMRAQAD